MKINSSYHNEILEDFEKRHPDWAKDIVSCVPKHTHAIRITFSNGVQIDYNIRTRTYREVQEYFYTAPNDITDAELNSDKWKDIISDPSSVNAFVYNG